MARRYFASAACLVAGHLVDLRLDHQRRRLGTLAGRGLEPRQKGPRGRVVLLAGLQPGHHIFAQRAQLVLGADARELLFGGLVVRPS